jgi:Skp family chaperone for outer membrane proteins
MKAIRNAMLALFCVIAISVSPLFAQGKASLAVGIVDVNAIVKEMPEATAADKQYADKLKLYQDTITQKRTDLETKLQNYQKQKAMMAADKQAAEEDKLNQEMQALQAYSKEKEDEMSRLREQLLSPIREKVVQVIQTVAEEEKMQLILSKDAATVPYFDPKLEITFKVIDRIKRGSK